MTDAQFIEQFEDCSLPAESFHHGDHVKAVWIYLQRYPLLETLRRFSESLKRFAASHGKPNLYHETITWAYVLLIHERIRRNGQDESWPEFMERNSDLFDWQNSILRTYYTEQTLSSDFARKTFVFPDN